MMFYNKTIMTLFNNLEHAGKFATNSENVFTTQVGNPGQSDVLQLQVQVVDDKISQVKFKAQGGVTTLATAEYLARLLSGMPLNKLSSINGENIINALQLPTQRINAAALAMSALQTIMSKIKNER